jgi:hypothetical protein
MRVATSLVEYVIRNLVVPVVEQVLLVGGECFIRQDVLRSRPEYFSRRECFTSD